MRPQGTSRQQDKVLATVIATRHALARQMFALGAAKDAQVVPCYLQLVATLEQVFRAEELAAEHINHRTVREQRERHARVLSALHQASTRIEAGNLELARDALLLLSRFLLMHRAGRDVVLAAASTSPRPGRQGRLARSRRALPLLRLDA
ncbi:MAG: hypothetical protein ACXWC4_05315 [Telluria sp.]